MTWRLPDGTTLLQNFVMADKECTPKRIEYWRQYIQYVFETEGEVECCIEVSKRSCVLKSFNF
jgi:uncharacterized protein Usg